MANDWGFRFEPTCPSDFNEFLGVEHKDFYETHNNEFFYSIALEISNFPLNKALS